MKFSPYHSFLVARPHRIWKGHEAQLQDFLDLHVYLQLGLNRSFIFPARFQVFEKDFQKFRKPDSLVAADPGSIW